MSRPQKVGGIILDRSQNLLIVFGRYSQKWGVPKGSLESGETNLQGALREIREETGLKLNPILARNLEHWTVNRCRLYLLQIDERKPVLMPNDFGEIETAIWLNLNNPYQLKQIKDKSNKMLLSVLRKIEQCLEAETAHC